MERHLGWLVGAAGAVLLGAVSPMLLLSSSAQLQAGASGVPRSPSAVSLPNDAPIAVNNPTASYKSNRSAMLTYHIRQAGVVATQAVGGGRVNKLATDTVGGHSVWKVYVTKPKEQWLVTVSKHDYSVMKKIHLA
ncbi:hypothetical protein [Alicyclobacillus sp. SO9]|uniref:hypothetical protein n=1 Tax=Alicyclobacillus sp. SO9 TaxID=2665646 RepID=UPI0018E869DA|nr:hypothetical protein [Alicyclobacillus sp. SO9]QQE78054.1 hypothetical protein GI364_19490 [Alicyclobacillus sp. SO9]